MIMKKHKNIVMLIIIFAVIIIFFGVRREIYQSHLIKIDNANLVKNKKFNNYPEQTQNLVGFIKSNLLIKEGIYTNPFAKVNAHNTNLATGKEMLTESSGMWLQYLIEMDSKDSFQDFYKNTKATFWKNDQFNYRYDPNNKKLSNVNATLDDLRIVRALIMYDQRYKTDFYEKDISEIYNHLKGTAIKDGTVLDYYDPVLKKGSANISLAYYDLDTLRGLEQSKPDQRKYEQQIKIVEEGYLSDDFPLYASNFNVKSRIYSSNDLNTSEALEVLLHLAQVGKLKNTSQKWLIEKVENKTLFNSYSTQGSPINHDTSVANYALAAQIFKLTNDKKHYQDAMTIIWQSQIKNGKYKGGLGDVKSRQFYSYNNLNALIAAE